MSQTYAVCENCKKINRVQLDMGKEPICGSCQKALPIHGAVVEGSDSTLQILINKSPLPIVVDVWAPWCGPCRSFAPTFEGASKKFADKFVFVKLNSEINQKISGQLGIRSIPTLVIFKKGAEVKRQSGALPSELFNQWLEQSK